MRGRLPHACLTFHQFQIIQRIFNYQMKAGVSSMIRFHRTLVVGVSVDDEDLQLHRRRQTKHSRGNICGVPKQS